MEEEGVRTEDLFCDQRQEITRHLVYEEVSEEMLAASQCLVCRKVFSPPAPPAPPPRPAE